MTDPFLDSIETTLENGEVPQQVNNRMVLAALRNLDDKMDKNLESCATNAERLAALETFKAKALAVISTAMFFWGVIITIFNFWII